MKVIITIDVCRRRLTTQEVKDLIALSQTLQVKYKSESSVQFPYLLLPKPPKK